MNASRKWLRSALLGSAAIGLLATGAQADELTALKGQLEALQGRVNELEAQKASAPQLPSGSNYLTFRRGQLDGVNQDFYFRPNEQIPQDRGITFGVNPTADPVPVPTTEVTVSGYVKGDLFYDTAADVGDSFSFPAVPLETAEEDPRFTAHARQTRLRVQSRSDTSIGQIRTLIEGDFHVLGIGNQSVSNSRPFRLRHGVGEWDFAPGWTFLAGQFWSNFAHRIYYPSTVDFFGPVGAPFVRQGQVRLTYKTGPFEVAVAAENPETTVRTTFAGSPFFRESTGGALVTDRAPDITGHIGWAGPNGINVSLDGAIQFLGVDTSNGALTDDDEIGFIVGGAVEAPLGSRITLYGHGYYYDGGSRYLVSGFGAQGKVNLAGGLSTIRGFSGVAGAALKVTDTSTINGIFGYHNNELSSLTGLTPGVVFDDLYSIHANYIWQPVSALRLGIEGIYGEADNTGRLADGSNLRIQFGAWFFF